MSPSSRTFSRRAFLLAAGGTAAGLALARLTGRLSAAPERLSIPHTGDRPPFPEWDFIQPRPARLDLWGRLTATTAVRASTGLNQPVVEWLTPNTVLPLLEELHDEGPNPNNDLWYRVQNGYIYTATVQPMRPYRMPEEVTEIDTTIADKPGFWAEVIVPTTIARTEPSGPAAKTENDETVYYTYASVYRVIGVELDTAGYRWYKVHDDKKNAPPVYVLARHMRRIRPEEFEPIHPDAADKHIVVTLSQQRLDCYEGDTLVFSTLISSGGGGFATPTGDWHVVLKQPSRHMYSDPEEEAFSDPDFFDLPGVPFNIFFTTLGHAIHGTYWHGDYGRPRSHGCLNVTPEAARWIYRWVEPPAPYSGDFVPGNRDTGTPVTVTA